MTFCLTSLKVFVSNILYNIAMTLFFNAIDREAKELLPHSILIVAERCRMVEIRQ